MHWTDWTLEAVVGVIAIVAAIGIFIAERKTKGLALAVVSDRAIVSQVSTFPLVVLYEGTPVRHPRLVALRLVNAGKEAISSGDFEEPLKLRLVDAAVLSAEATLTRPQAFRPSIALDGADAVRLDPCLMNQGDMVEIQMLIDGRPSRLLAESRISGVQDVEIVKLPRTSWGEPWRFSKFDFVAALLPVLVAVALAILWFLKADDVATRVAAGVLAVLAGVLWPWNLWRANLRNKLFLA